MTDPTDDLKRIYDIISPEQKRALYGMVMAPKDEKKVESTAHYFQNQVKGATINGIQNEKGTTITIIPHPDTTKQTLAKVFKDVALSESWQGYLNVTVNCSEIDDSFGYSPFSSFSLSPNRLGSDLSPFPSLPCSPCVKRPRPDVPLFESRSLLSPSLNVPPSSCADGGHVKVEEDGTYDCLFDPDPP